jgi:CRISPR-associated protein Cmr5
MNKVDKYIGQAIDEIKEIEKNEGKVLRVYSGYIASMGASIIQSGLLPTLAFFQEKQRDNTKGDKKNISIAILNIIRKNNANITNQTLLEYVIENQDKKESIKNQIIDITIALKLAIRTFELVEPDKK